MRSGAIVLAVSFSVAPAWADAVIDGTGRFIAQFEDGARVLVIRDTGTGAERHRRVLTGRDGTVQTGAALAAMPERSSFVLALTPAPELWEIALDPGAGPFHQGFVHAYVAGMEESLVFEQGMFARQWIELSQPVVALTDDPGDRFSVLGTRADGSIVRIHLAVRQEIGMVAAEKNPDDP